MPYTLKPSYTKINLGCVLRYLVLPLGNKIMDHKALQSRTQVFQQLQGWCIHVLLLSDFPIFSNAFLSNHHFSVSSPLDNLDTLCFFNKVHFQSVNSTSQIIVKMRFDGQNTTPHFEWQVNYKYLCTYKDNDHEHLHFWSACCLGQCIAL